MTTIAGDAIRMVLVSDSQFSDPDASMKFFEDKIFEVPGGFLGGCGEWADLEKVRDWLRSNKKTRKPIIKNDSDFIILTSEGIFTADKKLDFEQTRTHNAIGSGAMAAETVMRLGYTAEDAVYMACQVDLYSHGPIKTYSLDKPVEEYQGKPIYYEKS